MDAKESVDSLLGSATVHLENGDAKSVVYIVPPSFYAIITKVIIHSPTASLADGDDFDIGSGANANTWLQTNDLSAMTGVTDYKVITSTAKYALEAAGNVIGIKPITGATLDADATMEVWGRLIAA